MKKGVPSPRKWGPLSRKFLPRNAMQSADYAGRKMSVCLSATRRYSVKRSYISPIFTARRVCTARTMPWQDVCPTVRPTHAGIVCKRFYISSKFFHLRVAPSFSFFLTKRDDNTPTGTPLTGAPNARVV